MQHEAFRQAQRVSIYLSTSDELDTTEIIREMFRLEKMVFVPSYQGTKMKMVRLCNMKEYEGLPLTKWNIKQPDFKESREDAMSNGKLSVIFDICSSYFVSLLGHGIDLFIVPGVAFTRSGNRLGHGMGYYDKYLTQHAEKYSHKKITIMALALNEQIVDVEDLPMDDHDVRLNYVVTENS